MALDVVLCYECVNQVKTVGGVGHGITTGIAHLVLPRLFLDMFRLVCQSSLDVVMEGLVAANQLETDHISRQVIAGMFHIGTHAKILA